MRHFESLRAVLGHEDLEISALQPARQHVPVKLVVLDE